MNNAYSAITFKALISSILKNLTCFYVHSSKIMKVYLKYLSNLTKYKIYYFVIFIILIINLTASSAEACTNVKPINYIKSIILESEFRMQLYSPEESIKYINKNYSTDSILAVSQILCVIQPVENKSYRVALQSGVLAIFFSPSIEGIERSISNFERVGIHAPEYAVMALKTEIIKRRAEIDPSNANLQKMLDEQQARIRALRLNISILNKKIADVRKKIADAVKEGIALDNEKKALIKLHKEVKRNIAMIMRLGSDKN
jgi:hypothetical protein